MSGSGSRPWCNCRVQPGQVYTWGGGRSWFRYLRWVIVAGSLAIATVLIYRHDYVIGYMIGGLALLRVVYLVGTSRRALAGRSRYGSGPMWSPTGVGAASGTGISGPGGPVRSGPAGIGPLSGLLRELARPEFAVAARVIGLAPNDMRRAFNEGRSIAELAARAGVPLESVVSAMVADATETIDRRVAAGEMSEQQGQSVKARIPVWAGRLAHFHKGDLRRVRN